MPWVSAPARSCCTSPSRCRRSWAAKLYTELKREEAAKGLTLLCPLIEILEKDGVSFLTRVEEGTPAETIVRVADEENADLIVMFTDGRDGLGDLLIGSITERVLRNTDTPLLAVRH